MSANGLAEAFHAWRARLGPDRVLSAAEAERHYGANTGGDARRIAGALLVLNQDEVIASIEIAQSWRTPLYPISTGNNWGYGSASPVLDGCVVIDLSGMGRILELDAELGLVTLEPGVTQGQLRAYLDRNAPEFMVPTTGAGPHCSIVGNALERGYGITPYADHFGAVMSLEAVLPNGRVYRPALKELGGERADQAFKWGLGPYLDGLFAQGSIGIVTRMTIALARRPERVEAFFFGVADDRKLEAAVSAVQAILRTVGGCVGSINLMNARRVLAMTIPYPSAVIGDNGIIPENVIVEIARQHQVRPWMGVGTIYGDAAVVKAVRRVVRRCLAEVADRVVFMTSERSAFLARLFRSVPGLRQSRTAKLVEAIHRSMDLMEGSPGEVALPLAYWRSGRPPPKTDLNPSRDLCGLIWYPPLVPMMPAAAREYVEMVHDVCGRYGIEPLITLTSLSERCFDSSVPLLFDATDDSLTARAFACFDALFEAGQRKGFLPYRLGIHAMERVTAGRSTYWDLVATVKGAVDPGNVIAPGRYAPAALPGSPLDSREAAR